MSAGDGPPLVNIKRTDEDIRPAVNLWYTNRAEAEAYFGNISDWDVSSVTDMSYLFSEKVDFNDDIGNWDVSNVTNMEYMFYHASKFNKPIGNWDVSNVTNMDYMFAFAYKFNQAIGNWDVSHVISMNYMFHRAYKFNQPIGIWDVSNVISMNYMFYAAPVFNQDLTKWDISNVVIPTRNDYTTTEKNEAIIKGLTEIFLYCPISNENKPLRAQIPPVINTTKAQVIDMPAITSNMDVATSKMPPLKIKRTDIDIKQAVNLWCTNRAEATKRYGNISDWDVSSVTNMRRLFFKRPKFNDDITRWDVSNVTNMEGMFNRAIKFNQPIGDWDVSNVTNMAGMFTGAIAFNQPIGAWNVSKVTNMELMFFIASNFNQSIEEWNVASVGNNNNIFTNCPISNANKPVRFQHPPVINTPKPQVVIPPIAPVVPIVPVAPHVTTSNKPSPNIKRTNADIRTAVNLWTTNRVEAAKQYGHISNWDTSSVTNMSRLFENKQTFNDDISRWDVSNVTNMRSMFDHARSFNQPIGGWNVSNVTDVHRMFYSANKFNQPLESWDLPKLSPMSDMEKSMIFTFSGMMNSKNQPESLQDPSMKHLYRYSVRSNKPAVSANKPATTSKSASSGCVLCGGAKKSRRARRRVSRKRLRKGRRTQKRGAKRTRRR